MADEAKKAEEKEAAVTQDMIDAGKHYKETIEYMGQEFTPHRLSIGEKIKLGVLRARKLQAIPEEAVDEHTSQLCYAAAWLDISLDPKDNPDWKGSDKIYDEKYLFGLQDACWTAVEKKFFRSPAKADAPAASGSQG